MKPREFFFGKRMGSFLLALSLILATAPVHTTGAQPNPFQAVIGASGGSDEGLIVSGGGNPEGGGPQASPTVGASTGPTGDLQRAIDAIEALPAPESLKGLAENVPAEEVKAARALADALGEERLALLPGRLLAKLEALEHIRDILTDCVDLSCPWHYSRETLEELSRDEEPAFLTLEDLIEDYGVEPEPVLRMARAFSVNSNSHPRTLIQTADNENNAHTGAPDNDMDRMLGGTYSQNPIEVSFDIPEGEAPTRSAYLAIKAYDVDEEQGELDYVYLNDDIFLSKTEPNPFSAKYGSYNKAMVGYLSGTDSTWNTTILKVPLEKLKPGKNVVSIDVAKSGWVVRVDWIQLILDGGTKSDSIESFSLTLGEPVNSAAKVQVPATVKIVQTDSTVYATEYTLLDADGNALDAVFGKTSGTETVRLSMPAASQTGEYTIIGLLKDDDENIKAMDTVSFWFEDGKASIRPKLTHALTPETVTNGDVEITVSLADQMGCEKVSVGGKSVEAGDFITSSVSKNGEYSFQVAYTYGGTTYQYEYIVPVNNIDKTDPEIRYTAITVVYGAGHDEVAQLFAAALSVTDNHGEPSVSYTVPEDTGKTSGTHTIRVTATDLAGNTATKDCNIIVLPLQAKLSPAKAAQSQDGTYFTFTATLEDNGGQGDNIVETGFVYGALQNPTLDLNDGRAATASPVTANNGSLSARAEAAALAEGIAYYVRPYAKLQDGSASYGAQASFGLGVPEYGEFSVAYAGFSGSQSTFSITRAGGADGAQTVYYRTVNGSAVGGTHFDHAAGQVTFADGETGPKNVSVTEHPVATAYDGKTATAYSNADRTYGLEIYRVEGGATIAAGSAGRTMAKDGGKTVDRTTAYEQKTRTTTPAENESWVADHSGTGNGKIYFIHDRESETGAATNRNWNTSASVDLFWDAGTSAYLKNTAEHYYYRYELTAYEKENGYEHCWIGLQKPGNAETETSTDDKYTSSPIALDDAVVGPGLWSGVFELDEGKTAKTLSIPQAGSGKADDFGNIMNSYGNFVTLADQTRHLEIPIADTVYSYFSASGGGKEYWQVKAFTDYARAVDTLEPRLLAVAPMAPAAYLPGQQVTVSLIFDEIVDEQNSTLDKVSVDTSWGTLLYAGGADTNVLSFTGAVGQNVTPGTVLKVNEILNAGYIKDMADAEASTSGGSTVANGNTSVSTGSSPIPTVSVGQIGNSNGTLTAAISAQNAAKLEYVWSTEAAAPASGWRLTDPAGGSVATRQTSGTWYLHARATNADGAAAYDQESITLTSNPDLPLPLPELTAEADNADWARERNIEVSWAPVDGKVTYTGPGGVSGSVDGNGSGAVNVTQNGLYNFTLTFDGETVKTSASVSKIDRQAPELTLRAPNPEGTVYHTLTFAGSASDALSGVERVEYALSGGQNPPAGDWTTAALDSGGGFSIEYAAGQDEQETIYLHLRAIDKAGNTASQKTSAYTVVRAPTEQEEPVITLDYDGAEPSGWVTGPLTLNWKVTNPGAGGYTVYTGMLDKNGVPAAVTNSAQGSISVESNGLYSVSVVDKNQNDASAFLVVSKIDSDAPVLENYAVPGGWAQSKTVALSGVTDAVSPVLDANGNPTGVYDGSGVKMVEWKPENGSYTVIRPDARSGDYAFEVKQNGDYTVRLTDLLNNRDTYTIKVTGIDTAGPSIENISGNPGSWTSQDAAISFTVTDAVSGVQSVTVKRGTAEIPAAQGSGGTWSFTAAQNGVYTITAVDAAGNTGTQTVTVDKIDKTEPGISASCDTSGSAKLLVTLQVAAGESGVRSVTVQKGTGTTAVTIPYDNGYSYKITDPGTYTFTVVNGAGKNGATELTAHQVSFDVPGISSQLVVSGRTATKPQNPTKTGYTFSEWQSAGAAFDFHSAVAADTALTAVWSLNPPTVNLSAAYHGSPVSDQDFVDYSEGDLVYTAAASHEAASGVTFAYQWKRDGSVISGANGQTYTVARADAGAYRISCTVAAEDGAGLSSEASANPLAVTVQKVAYPSGSINPPRPSAITYGDALAKSQLTGGSAGTFEWVDGSIQPAAADSNRTPYSVKFTSDNPNYHPTVISITLTVNRKALIPSVGHVENKTYDGKTAATGAIRLEGAVNNEAPSATGTFAFTDKNAGKNKTVFVAGIALENGWDANYTLSETSLNNVATSAEIYPKEVGLTWSGYENLTYTGNPANVSAKAAGLIEDDVCAVVVAGGDRADAGPHTARAVALDNPNYKLPDRAAWEYTIAKAPVTFVVSENVHTYDNGVKTASVVQSAGETPAIGDRFTVSYRDENGNPVSPVNVGEYSVHITLDSENFKFAGESDAAREKKAGTLTISAAPYPEQDQIAWPSAGTLTYGQTLGQSALNGGSTGSFGGSGTFAWLDGSVLPTVENQGYSIVFTPDNTGYQPVIKVIDVRVSPKELTIRDAAAAGRAYEPGNLKVTVTGSALNGVVGQDDVSPNLSGASGRLQTPDAGQDKAVTVTGCVLTGADAGNYTLKQPEGVTVTISKAAGSGSVAMGNWSYSGTALNSPVPVSETNGIANVTYHYTGRGSTKYNSAERPTAVGNYIVTAVFAATDNYDEVIAQAEFSIHSNSYGDSDNSEDIFDRPPDHGDLSTLPSRDENASQRPGAEETQDSAGLSAGQGGDTLPQTGRLLWPVWIMLAAGCLMLILGICSKAGRSNKNRDEKP